MADQEEPPLMTPDGKPLVVFGPDANCTLELCPLSATPLGYQPNLGASISFMVLFAIAMAIHIYLGVRRRTWWFMACMCLGCVSEIIGYGGRIILRDNPFSFDGFMIQIILITSGPVYFSASIYVTLSKAIHHFASDISRIRPALFYWIFIGADVVCLILQAGGGALSTTTSGSSQTGVDLALAGLILQVVVLVVFCGFFVDYMYRFRKSGHYRQLSTREKLFFGFLALAIVLILGRCSYRVHELSEGYDSPNFKNEALFYGLEGVMIVAAVFALCIGHPGMVFGREPPEQTPEKR